MKQESCRHVFERCRSAWPVAAIFVLALPASGCMLTDQAALPLQPEVRPPLADVKDLDSAALNRLAKATAQNGGDAVDPVILYRQLAARAPSDPAPRIELGRLLIKRNDIDGADAAFREALALAPNNVDAHVGAAQVLLARRQSDDALAGFETVLADAPDNVRALNGRGLALDQLGRRDEAQASYRHALTIDPDNAVARNNLGVSLTLVGRRKEARAILEPRESERITSPQGGRSARAETDDVN
ncbi:tetratricopeptide repeat protein [Bradyrhizobium sp. Arg237L]|uniref:tetratricopeptide repeat protein n=1 Tax=Bradyrhizobium sp. Arg237L TaxID=3003352 RepID=UPI00249DA432|nr:tetratricopeptide repeat protein [Bradyrhizobium sp. Arg237L]MDI4231942.1 tetratricopeptide repeat protein [Bradyrhizobium sp. Arg237L]